MEENFDDKKVYIDKNSDNWNQYITMESTQEVTPTSSIGDSINIKNNAKNDMLDEIIEKKSGICENETKNYKNEDRINVVIDTETDSPIEDTENENNSNEDDLQNATNSEKENVKSDYNMNVSKSGRLEEKISLTKKGTGSRARKAEHQSGVPGVYWQESSQRWIAQWSDSLSGRRITHGFSARVYGFENAKQMAIKSRIEAIEKGKATARKLHETMDINSKLNVSNKRNRLASKEKNILFNSLINNHNIRSIMNNITDEGIGILLEEMKHLKEDVEYEGIFWHPINKVWIGVWLDSITHETCTQSFPHEISDDGIDISRLKAIEWRLKLINEKKLRDNVVEYVNNKEFKYAGNYILSNNSVDFANCINNKSNYENNNSNNIVFNNLLYYQNYYNILMSQLFQMQNYNNYQSNIGGIHSSNIENIIYLGNLLSSNSSHSKNSSINRLLQMNSLITNYLNNINISGLNSNIKYNKNTGNIESEITNVKNNVNNDNKVNINNNETENSIEYIGKMNNESNMNINHANEVIDNIVKNRIIGDISIDSNINNYFTENNIFHQMMNGMNGTQLGMLNNNINNLLLGFLNVGNTSSTMNNNNNGIINNILLSQKLNNYISNYNALNQMELLELQHFLHNYCFYNSNNNGINSMYNNEINDILKNFITSQANDFSIKKDYNIGNTNFLNKFDIYGVNNHQTNIRSEDNAFIGTIDGMARSLNTGNNILKNPNNDMENKVSLNDLNLCNVNILSKFDLLNSINMNDNSIGTDTQNYSNTSINLCNNNQNNNGCHNLSRSETSSSSLSSNSTDLSLVKNIESSIIMDISEANSAVPTITSTPMSISTPSSAKLKTTPKKKVTANTNYKSGIPGVYWKTRDQEWVAEWYDQNRKRHSRHFYVKKYGFNEAKKLAIQCRLNAVNSGEAVLRSTHNNNFNTILTNSGDLIENNLSSASSINNIEDNTAEDVNVQ
ncbi:hypothetical protein RS030_6811 [Cryptosporidium xiaoi]|uniref:AP2/ERF domain-containing protein n=1 Tax=Cryptosporidium xiaoi TaxID=659607 RepID=A0AAV9XVV3_9CRYT